MKYFLPSVEQVLILKAEAQVVGCLRDQALCSVELSPILMRGHAM